MVVVLAGEGHRHETSKLGGSVVAPSVSHACGIGPRLAGGSSYLYAFPMGQSVDF